MNVVSNAMTLSFYLKCAKSIHSRDLNLNYYYLSSENLVLNQTGSASDYLLNSFLLLLGQTPLLAI